ncbi:MAG: tetratricopeptide repeat protein, partial [Lysobacterales bacterium]
DKLKGVGRLDLMASVTDKALTLFAASKPGSLTDDELTQQSRALVQIGQIRLDEAQYEPAMDAFQRAYQRSAELTTRHPDDGRFMYDRAQAEYWIGYVYWQQRKLAEANEWWTRYRDSTLALVKIDPHNQDWQRETTDGEHNLAVLALDRGDLDAAQRGFEAELAKKEEFARRQPDDADLASQVADTTSWLGNVAEQRGDLAGAQRLFGEQARQLARLRILHPQDFGRLSEWASAQELLAGSLATTGRNEESQHALAGASDAYLALTKHDPNNVSWRVSLANVQVTRAEHAFATDHVDQAEGLLSVVMQHIRVLEDPKALQGNPQIHRVLSRGWLLRARMAQHHGDLQSATEAAGQSLAEARAETMKDAIDDGSLADRAAALLLLGALQQAQSRGAPPKAWTQAHTLLATRAPGSHYWRLLDPWLRVCRSTGDDAGARIALDRLNASGYVPLQPWPASAAQPFPVTAGDSHVH